MMGISYAVSVYDIESSTELFAIYLADGCICMANFAPKHLFLHNFQAQLVVLRAQTYALFEGLFVNSFTLGFNLFKRQNIKAVSAVFCMWRYCMFTWKGSFL